MTLPNVAVIGLGCIGGSFARALHGEGKAHVSATSASQDDRERARAEHIDVAPDDGEGDKSDDGIASAVRNAAVVIIAVPVQAIAEVAAAAIRSAPAEAAIIHCGGVQSRVSLHLDEPSYARAIGAHPLAGSHDSGFGAARADLFAGCTVSIETRASDDVREWMTWLWRAVGAVRLDYRAAEEHDTMMAWISHLPQLASTALASTFAEAHIDPATVGPGARDTTRLAASTFDQWSELVQAQPAVLDSALEKLERNVASIRAALAKGDQRALRKLWDSARDWRRAAEPSA
jgi:prephenate dehydrogenase